MGIFDNIGSYFKKKGESIAKKTESKIESKIDKSIDDAVDNTTKAVEKKVDDKVDSVKESASNKIQMAAKFDKLTFKIGDKEIASKGCIDKEIIYIVSTKDCAFLRFNDEVTLNKKTYILDEKKDNETLTVGTNKVECLKFTFKAKAEK
ncbi:MAG: hypothetical protein WCR67_04210 [Bacilli bacterium]